MEQDCGNDLADSGQQAATGRLELAGDQVRRTAAGCTATALTGEPGLAAAAVELLREQQVGACLVFR